MSRLAFAGVALSLALLAVAWPERSTAADGDDEHPSWTRTVTDEALKTYATSHFDIYEKFLPEFDELSNKLRQTVRSQGILDLKRRPIRLRERHLLWVTFEGPGVPGGAEHCDWHLFFGHDSEELTALADHQTCSAGRTTHRLLDTVVPFDRKTPLFIEKTSTMEQTGGRYSTYEFLHLTEEGEFETVLTFSTDDPRKTKGADEVEFELDCVGPHFRAMSFESASPPAILGTVTCRGGPFGTHDDYRVFSRLWTWSGDGYELARKAPPDTPHPPILGGDLGLDARDDGSRSPSTESSNVSPPEEDSKSTSESSGE